MRQAIRAVPDGVYRSQVDIESLGETITLPCAVIVDGDELTVDWEGAPPQRPIGGLNCTYSYMAAHTVYALKSILTPDVPSNAGCFRPLHVRARPLRRAFSPILSIGSGRRRALLPRCFRIAHRAILAACPSRLRPRRSARLGPTFSDRA